MYNMICSQTHILYIISIHSWTFLYIIQSKCRSMLWTGQCLKPRTQERYGSHCLCCGIWRHQHVESHGQGTLHWEKMWDRTDRTSKFLSRIAYINFDGFQSHDLGKCIRPSWVANNPFLPTLEAGAPLETTFPEIPEAPWLPKAFYFICDQYWSVITTVQ